MTEKQQAAIDDQAASDARHAEWDRLAKERDERVTAEFDKLYPASEGWIFVYPNLRMRAKYPERQPAF